MLHLSDGDGLALQVEPNGSKLWRFRYRFAGKENMLTLGPFPEVSLATAHQKCDDARKLLAQGTDPAQQRRLEKVLAVTTAKNTFGAIAAEYILNLEDQDKAASTTGKNRWLLEDLAKPRSTRHARYFGSWDRDSHADRALRAWPRTLMAQRYPGQPSLSQSQAP